MPTSDNQNTVRTITELLRISKNLKPKVISQEMINHKRELGIESKIASLRESKSIPPEYLDLLAFPQVEAHRDIIVDILIQVFAYISSTHTNKIVMSEFKKSKKSNLNATSLSELYAETKTLLKLLKSAEEVRIFKENPNNKKLKISKKNVFSKKNEIINDEDEEPAEQSAEKINLRLRREISTYIQMLKEAKASIAAEGMT